VINRAQIETAHAHVRVDNEKPCCCRQSMSAVCHDLSAVCQQSVITCQQSVMTCQQSVSVCQRLSACVSSVSACVFWLFTQTDTTSSIVERSCRVASSVQIRSARDPLQGRRSPGLCHRGREKDHDALLYTVISPLLQGPAIVGWSGSCSKPSNTSRPIQYARLLITR